MKLVKLYGELATEFGDEYLLDVSSVGQAVRLLEANFSGRFARKLSEGEFHLYITRQDDEDDLIDAGKDIQQYANMHLGHSSVIHIMPVAEGAKSGKGFLSILIGVVFIAAAFITAGASTLAATAMLGGLTTASNVALLGLAMVLGGIGTLLTPTPKVDTNFGAEDQKQSFLFNGAVNTIEQGGCVPVVYGEVFCGSTVISAAIAVEKLEADATTTRSRSQKNRSSNNPELVFWSKVTHFNSSTLVATAPVTAGTFVSPWTATYDFNGDVEAYDMVELNYGGMTFTATARPTEGAGTGCVALLTRLKDAINNHPRLTAVGSSSGASNYTIVVTSDYTAFTAAAVPRNV